MFGLSQTFFVSVETFILIFEGDISILRFMDRRIVINAGMLDGFPNT